ncbi:efflux RND transporter periplasmic adaptor subunit [Roseovarius sp. E0-M6]|uniref:efflux RND transporter periplasmic adaptor subunit n=1 Tax=Roseovarius sp. E0-M6 TaxID=3127118 RepID=UPI00300FF93C
MADQDTKSSGHTTLEFKDDKGASRSTWVAAAILVAIIAWMGSGFIFPSEDPSQETADRSDPAPVSVAVTQSRAEVVTLYFQAEGQAMPDRDTTIRAEASGDVAEVLVEKGDDIEAGGLIARLTTDRVEANLRSAQQERARAQREFDNATELLQRGVATKDRVAQARAALAAAKSQVATAQEALENAQIVAPFAGRIETLILDEGEFVQAGSDVGRIVDNHPLTVEIRVPQQMLNRIKSGQMARVTFITGEKRQGRVTFVGTSAASATRTFLAEITVANEDGTIPAGISANVRIPTGEEAAHFISPSIVSLSPEGETGVKTVQDGKVAFHEIEVVRAEVDGVWVKGLPQEAALITVGQGFVRDGEAVRARPKEVDQSAEQLAEDKKQ